MVIPIVIGVLDTVTKGLVQGLYDLEIRGWVETIQTTALLRSARVLRRVLETWGDSPANAGRKTLKWVAKVLSKDLVKKLKVKLTIE